MNEKPSIPTEHANELIDADKRYVWHPFTPMQPWLDAADLSDALLVAGEGFELIDVQGRRYIDGFGSLWCNLHGHRVTAIDDAIRQQLDRIAHSTLLGFASPPSIRLAEKLITTLPECMSGLRKVFFSDSGATATEIACKMAFQYWQNRGQAARRKFIAFREGYHGDTVGAVSLGGIDLFHRVFRPLLFETTFVDCPNEHYGKNDVTLRSSENEAGPLAQTRHAFETSPGEYCAVFVEPMIQGAGGMLTQPPGFMRALRQLTREHDVLLIADEVATGFCRTGTLYACEHEQIGPDLLCLGKGLTGGYLPVSATLATQEIFDAFLGEAGQARTFYHGHTFTGNALGCAAAVASLELIFTSGLLASLPAKVELMRRHLSALADHPHVGDIRQCGLMAGIELVKSRGRRGADRRPWEQYDWTRRIGSAVCRTARPDGLIIRPLDDVIVLMPPPAIDLPTLERMMSIVVRRVREFAFPTE
ncbi:MAG: adenosylmethionine--8-amino-7-oxononanoate transaminase [Phycisphaerae bacterium]|nr:adenosylmethionine--8-amino-7-oxononanoate transaminase [Phycisphaerae bacterium]